MTRRMGFASLLLFSGCVLGDLSGPREHHGQMGESKPLKRYPNAPAVWDRHPYGDVHARPVGTWVHYSIGQGQEIDLFVVAQEGEDRWVEVRDSREAPGISLRRISPGGVVRSAFYAEPPDDRGEAQEIRQAPANLEPAGFEGIPIRPDFSRHAEESFNIGGHTVRGCLESTVFEDDLGRSSSITRAWSEEVPSLYVGCPDGGLIQARRGAVQIQLVGYGTDARPRVQKSPLTERR